MVLLTQSTVSVILSSGVVCIFTFLLFLSGYILQQQSVRNIQVALKPSPPPIRDQIAIAKRGLSHKLGHNWDDGQETPLSSFPLDQGNERSSSDQYIANKGNYAYLQLISNPDPSDICSAILFFKTLATNGTAIQDRLFMYPAEWDRMTYSSTLNHDHSNKNKKNKNKNKNKDNAAPINPTKSISKALSLLRAASVEYDIWLLPIDMSLATSAGYKLTDTKLLRLGQIQFMQYDSVLYVRTPGIILDIELLDSVLLSRPLPMRHDKTRIESYANEAWIPMPLRPDRDEFLPPVYLIAVNNVGGRVEARGHIPNVGLPGFGELITSPWELDRTRDQDDRGHSVDGKGNGNGQQQRQGQQPGYVYFERDYDGHVSWKDNSLFGTWRAQQYGICEGLDLDDVPL